MGCLERELRHAKERGIDIDRETLEQLYSDSHGYEFAVLLRNKKFNSKRYFSSVCEKCGNEYRLQFCKFNVRTKEWNYCPKCYLKEITSSVEWKNKNSEAQKIAQNRPEVKQKMSVSLIKMWAENPEKKELMTKNVKAFYDKPGRREQWSKMSVENNLKSESKFCNTPYSGYVWASTKRVRFDSLLELQFIIQQTELGNIVERYKGYIEYENEYIRRYIPDFIINDTIVEVKSKYFYQKHLEVIALKADAVKNLGLRYSIITEEEIKTKYFKRCKQSVITLLKDFDVVFNKKNKYSNWLYEIKI